MSRTTSREGEHSRGTRNVDCIRKNERITTEGIPDRPNKKLEFHTNLGLSQRDCVSTLMKTNLDEHGRSLRGSNTRGRGPNPCPPNCRRLAS